MRPEERVLADTCPTQRKFKAVVSRCVDYLCQSINWTEYELVLEYVLIVVAAGVHVVPHNSVDPDAR